MVYGSVLFVAATGFTLIFGLARGERFLAVPLADPDGIDAVMCSFSGSTAINLFRRHRAFGLKMPLVCQGNVRPGPLPSRRVGGGS